MPSKCASWFNRVVKKRTPWSPTLIPTGCSHSLTMLGVTLQQRTQSKQAYVCINSVRRAGPMFPASAGCCTFSHSFHSLLISSHSNCPAGHVHMTTSANQPCSPIGDPECRSVTLPERCRYSAEMKTVRVKLVPAQHVSPDTIIMSRYT